MSLTLTLEDKGFFSALQNAQNLEKLSSPYLKSIGTQWKQLVEGNFLSQTDSFGVPWAPLRLTTVKLKGFSRILYKTGQASRSFEVSVNGTELELGSNRKFIDGKDISFHQVGYEYTAGKAGSRRVVARPMLPLGQDLPQQWDSVIDSAITRLFDSL